MRFAIVRIVCFSLGLLLGLPTSQAFDRKDLDGRWVADGRDLVLDFAPCGTRFCARLVKSDKSCGATVMSMDQIPPEPSDEGVKMEGRLDLPGEPHPYDYALVQAGSDPGGPPSMDLWAHDKLHYEERDYAFEARLARTGPALCRAEPAS